MLSGPPPPPPPPRPGIAAGGAPHTLSIFSKQPPGATEAHASVGGVPGASRRANLLSAYSQYVNHTTDGTPPPRTPPAVPAGGPAPVTGTLAREAPPPAARPYLPGASEAKRNLYSLPSTQVAVEKTVGSLGSPPPSVASSKAAAFDASLSTPPPSMPAPSLVSLSGDARSIAKNSEATRQQESVFFPRSSQPIVAQSTPPPVPSSRTFAAAGASVGYPLATRVGRTALGPTASSRASSSSRPSSRDSSEISGRRVLGGGYNQHSTFSPDVVGLGEKTSPVTMARQSCPPPWRNNSMLVGLEKTSSAAAEEGEHRSSCALDQSSSTSPGLHRGVPSFLQSSLDDCRTRHRSLSGSVSTTAASRGRKLLEAALTSHSSRNGSSRNTALTTFSALSEQQSFTSLREDRNTPMRDKETPYTVPDPRDGVHSVMSNGRDSEPTPSNHSQDRRPATTLLSSVPRPMRLGMGEASSGTGYAASSHRSLNTCGNGHSHTRDAVRLPSSHLDQPQSVNTWDNGPQRAQTPSQGLQSASGDNGVSRDGVSAASRPSARLKNLNGLIADEVAVSGAEVGAADQTHALLFKSRERLPTSSGQLPQSTSDMEGNVLVEHKKYGSFTTESNLSAAPITYVNPFSANNEKSDSGGAAGASPSLLAVSSEESKPFLPPQLPLQPSGSSSTADAAKATSSSHLDGGTHALEKFPSSRGIPMTEAAGSAGAPLPPFMPPNSADTAAPTGLAAGFVTPRGGGVNSVPLGQRQQPQPAQIPSSYSNSYATLDRGRGAFAASPYVHDEGARSLTEESPMPVRPASFDNAERSKGAETEAVECEDYFGNNNTIFNGIEDGDSGCTAHRSMGDRVGEGAAADQQQRQSQMSSRGDAVHPSLVSSSCDAEPFRAVAAHARSNGHRVPQQKLPIQQEPSEKLRFRDVQDGQLTQLVPQTSARVPPAPSTGLTVEHHTSRMPPRTAQEDITTSLGGASRDLASAKRQYRPLGSNPTPGNLVEERCHDNNPPLLSNPFLESTDHLFSNVPTSDVENTPVGSTMGRNERQATADLLNSVLSADKQREPPPYPHILRSPNCLSASSLELSSSHPPLRGSVTAAAASGVLASAVTNAVAGESPMCPTLVNPFSKSVLGLSCSMAAAGANTTGGGTVSDGASLTGSFTSGPTRRKLRSSGASCFAIFVGGATLPPGVPGSAPSGAVQSFPCIAACFNTPNASQPQAASSGRGVMGQSMVSVNPRTLLGRPPSLGGSTRASTSSPRAVGAGHLGGSAGAVVVFCTVVEALTVRGSMVDRKGVRGTEYGRRYVRALADAVLPCALLSDKWVAQDEATAAGVSGVIEVLKGCVCAPLGEVVEVMLMDALPQKAEDSFVWKENGGCRLAEMLTVAAQEEARRQAATGGSRSATLSTTAAPGVTGVARASDLAMEASPLNSVTGALGYDHNERGAVLRRVEDLLCRGQRIEAAEAALDAHLYAHALLISMMCPNKDLYLRSVQAVMLQELSGSSPLAHAYGVFNEMPLPPLVPPPPKSDEEGNKEVIAGASEMGGSMTSPNPQQIFLRDQAILRQTWRRHAAVLLANFTRHSGDGLLQLAVTLQQLHLIEETHTCLLLLHLTPLGMAAPARAGAAPLPPASSLSSEDARDLLPRQDQRQVMEEIRRRMGIVGGTYHPTLGCRTGFLTPITTVLTQLVHLVSALLSARAPPLQLPESAEPPVPFHGLPSDQSRSDVGYRMMQVLWLRELGLARESAQALRALLQRMPPPLAFSLRVPPRTLNELVYLFGGVPPQVTSEDAAAAARGAQAPIDGEATPQLRSVAVADPSSPSQEGVQQAAGLRTSGLPSSNTPASMLPDPKGPHVDTLPSPPPGAQQQQAPPSQIPDPHQGASQSLSSTSSATAQLTKEQRAAALQPPAAPTDGGKSSNVRAAQASTSGKPRQSEQRRSRSLDVLRNFFFRRGSSEAPQEGKADEAKPMHLDSGRPPAFDPATGRWLFDETEEEKRLRELVKAGPPKMAARNTALPAPVLAAASGPQPHTSAQPPQLAPRQDPSLDNRRPGPGATPPVPPGGGIPAPRPGAGLATTASRDRPVSLMAGRGAARPGGRPQYVDMFNTTN